MLMFLLRLSRLLRSCLTMLVSRGGLRWFLGLLRLGILVLVLMLSHRLLLCRRWFGCGLPWMRIRLNFRMLVFFTSAVFVPCPCWYGGLEVRSFFSGEPWKLS